MVQETETHCDNYALLAAYASNHCKAVKIKDQIFQELVEKGDINYQIPSTFSSELTNKIVIGDMALHIAIKNKYYENFKVLMKNGADYIIQNANNETPIHLIVKQLYENSQTLSELRECLDLVLSAQLKLQNSSNPKSKEGISHFHAACIRSRTKFIKMFLKNDVPADEAVSQKSSVFPGYTPLHFAARFSSISSAKLLLNHGVDINSKDTHGWTPLDILIHRNMKIADWLNMATRDRYSSLKTEYEINEEIITMIMEKMALEDQANNSQLPILHVACTLQDTSKLEQELSKKNVKLDQLLDEDLSLWPGYAPLHFAARFNKKSVKLLLENGAIFSIQNAEEITPFDLCLQRYTAQDLCAFLKLVPAWKDINFAKTDIRLSNALAAMKDEKKFDKFLKSLNNINMSIHSKSPIFPGYTILHVVVALSQKIKTSKPNKRSFYDSDDDTAQFYWNCRKEQENIYLRRVKMCLELGVDVTTVTSNGSTPLHLAFKLQRESAVNLLLDYYENKDDFVNADNLSHLHIACATGSNSMVKELIAKCTDHINRALTTSYKYRKISNQNCIDIVIAAGSTPLHIAVACQNSEIVKLLIDHNADLYVRDSNGLTPIHQTIVLGSNENNGYFSLQKIANSLLSRDDLKECETSSGLSHLHVASYMNNVKAIEILLSEGSNIDAEVSSIDSILHPELSLLKNMKDFNPLHLAFKANCNGAIVSLIRSGASISLQIDKKLRVKHSNLIAITLINELASREYWQKFGLTKLHAACATLDLQRVQELLEGGADVNAQVSKDSPLWPGNTALHFVLIRRGEYPLNQMNEMIELLVAGGADISLKNSENDTTVHRALELLYESDGVFQMPNQLLDRRTNFKINPTNNQGMSHFHIACFDGRVGIVEKFLKHAEIDLNQRLDFASSYWAGNTALHIAARYDNNEVVDLLLKYGADVYMRNMYYRIPIHEAANYEEENPTIVTLAKTEKGLYSTTLVDRTTLELLLCSKRSTTDKFRLFLKDKNRVNLFNPASGEGFIAMAISNDSSVEEFSENSYFRAVTDTPKENGPDESGRTPIHNIVSLLTFNGASSAPTDVYMKALELLIQADFDVDHQDAEGQTALHTAVQFQNAKGFTALLNVGADINISDNHGNSPLFYISKWFKEQPSYIKESHKEIVKVCLDQLHKMQLVGIYISGISIIHGIILGKNLDGPNEISKNSWQVEKESLINRKVNLCKWKLWDFLFETGALASYPKMMPAERQAIDYFYKTNAAKLLQDYPHFGGLLMLQYRKAQTRIELIKAARLSLAFSLGNALPEICYDCILGYLGNDHFKKLIEKC